MSVEVRALFIFPEYLWVKFFSVVIAKWCLRVWRKWWISEWIIINKRSKLESEALVFACLMIIMSLSWHVLAERAHVIHLFSTVSFTESSGAQGVWLIQRLSSISAPSFLCALLLCVSVTLWLQPVSCSHPSPFFIYFLLCCFLCSFGASLALSTLLAFFFPTFETWSLFTLR